MKFESDNTSIGTLVMNLIVQKSLLGPHVFLLFAVGLCAAQSPSPDIEDLSAAVQGHVNLGDGNPCAATVALIEERVVNGRLRLDRRCSVSTDIEGKYRCSNLPTGRYLVMVHPHPAIAHADSGQDRFPSFYLYPGTTQLDDAQSVTLHHDDVVVRDLMLTKSRTSRVSGILTSRPPSASIALFLISDGKQIETGTRFDYASSSGQFYSLMVPDGDYLVRAVWTEKGTQVSSTARVSVRGRDVDDLQLTANQEANFRGSIASRGVESKRFAKGQIVLNSRDSENPDFAATVKEDGSFFIAGIPEGKYVVSSRGEPQGYVDSIAINSREQPDINLSVTQSQSTSTLTVNVAPKGGTVNGSIRDSSATDLSRSLVIIESEDTELPLVASVDRFGHFSLDGLAPGSYRAYAWRDAMDIEYRSMAFMRRYRDKSTSVSVRQGARSESVELSFLSSPVD